ncbi:MAG: NIPSNAP family protein [Pseudomonadota bacterium]
MSSPIFRTLLTLAAVAAFISPAAIADGHSLYELRTYTANEGKIDDLNKRFQNHTMGLFEKHGMKNIAYWTPADDPNKLIYIIAHKDADAAKAGWQGFVNDPEWQKVYADSIADGLLVANIESIYMTKTGYSP